MSENTDLLPRLQEISTDLRGAGTHEGMLTAAIAKLDVVINELSGVEAEPTTMTGEPWVPNDGKGDEQPVVDPGIPLTDPAPITSDPIINPAPIAPGSMDPVVSPAPTE